MKKIFLLIPVLAMSVACQVSTVIGERGYKREVEIRLSTGVERSFTRADATDETIKTVDVLVFDGNGKTPEDATFLYSRYAWQKRGDIYSTILKIGNQQDIYFAINARKVIEAAGITEGATWREVRESLILMNPQAIDRAADGLPMWGYRHSISVVDTDNNNFGVVRLLRAVASTDISVSASNFELEAGHIVFGSKEGYLAFTANAANMDFGTATGVNIENPQADFKLIAPEVPAGTSTSAEWRYAIPAGVADPDAIEDILYFYENEGPVGTNGKRYTKVVVEGKWDDPATGNDVTSYYPLAFRDPGITDGSNDKLPAIRNRKYIINITGVNGNGYPSLEEAKEGEDMNITYRVIPWDNWEDGDIFADGSKFISLGDDRNFGLRKRAVLYRNATSTDVIMFETNISLDRFAMTLTGNGQKKAVTPEERAAGVIDKMANEFYEIKLVEDETAGGKIYGHFLFTAQKDYAASPVCVLTVVSGRISFDINIEQRDSDPQDWSDGGNKNEEL